MCVGTPMRVTEVLASGAVHCLPYGEGQPPHLVEASLLDSAPIVDDWLLVHVDVAIRSLDPVAARQIGDALQAVTAAAAGQPFEHLLADLIDREPQLPPHLRETTGDGHG